MWYTEGVRVKEDELSNKTAYFFIPELFGVDNDDIAFYL